METFANELSFGVVAADKVKAREHMRSLIETIRAAHRLGVDRTLRTVRMFASYYIAPEYPIAAWLSDNQVLQEERQFFKAVAAKAPFADDLFYAAQKEEEFVCEIDGVEAIGLGAALLTQSIAISYAAATKFLEDPVQIRVLATECGDVKEYEADVCCLSSPAQVKSREEWIISAIQSVTKTVTGESLVQGLSVQFPNLVFCEKATAFLKAMTGNEVFFQIVVRHLGVLNAAVQKLVNGCLPPVSIRWSNESSQTMRNGELKEMRTFRCPDNVYRVMEAHSKIIGANIRIHFLINVDNSTAYVGYIGAHLPTSRE